MLNLLNSIVIERRSLVVDEKYIVDFFKAFDSANRKFKYSIFRGMEIKSCESTNEPHKWTIYFNASNNKWRKLIAELKKGGRIIVLKENDKLYLM